jgi:hypothetical protein
VYLKLFPVIFITISGLLYSLERSDTTKFFLQVGWHTDLDNQGIRIPTWQAGSCRIHFNLGLEV